MNGLSDQQLLRAYVEERSEAAFAELARRHVDLLYSAALRMVGDVHLAQDVTQGVFLALAQSAPQLTSHPVLSGWLHRTAHHLASKTVRTEVRRRAREQNAAMNQLACAEPEPAWEEVAPHLDAGLANLNESERDAVLLRYFEGKSASEMAGILSIRTEAAQKRVNRGVEHLRRFLAKQGVAVGASGLAFLVSANAVQGAPAGLAASICTGTLAGIGATTGAVAAKTLGLTALQKALMLAAVSMVGAGATVLILKATHASRAARLNAQHNIQGAWQGTLFTGSAGVDKGEYAKTRVVLKLTKENGDYKALVDAIDWGRKNMPATIDYTFPSLRLTVNPQMVLDGRVNAEGSVMNFNGTVLRRTDTPDAVPEPVTEAEFAPRAGSDLQGYWKGTIDVKPNPLPLNWKIAEQSDGTFRAELDNPHQGALGQPARVSYRRPTVELVLMSRNGMFRGEINRDNTELKGSFIQGGQAVEAIFKREDYAAEQAQEALKDYSFRSESDLQGHWQGQFLLREKPVFPVRLALDIAKLPDGAFSATVASIYDMANDGPRVASEFRYSVPEVRIAWKWMDDRFEGKLQKRKLIGTWFHGARKWPLVFERKH